MSVPRFLTPIPVADLPRVLDDGHGRARGISLPLDAIALGCAQLEVEHGRRVVSAADVSAHPEVAPMLGMEVLWAVWRWNLGNHDATAEERADAWLPIFQTVPENEVGPRGAYKAQHYRRAYEDAGAGAEGYWRCLYLGFGDAYDRLYAGDVPGFVHALKVGRYFTASEAQYELLEEGLVAAWRPRVAAAFGG